MPRAIWSGATMACGLALSYGQLVAARMAVGFGEAGGVPPSYAVITDSFPPGRRGFAFGIYNLGPPIGVAPMETIDCRANSKWAAAIIGSRVRCGSAA